MAHHARTTGGNEAAIKDFLAGLAARHAQAPRRGDDFAAGFRAGLSQQDLVGRGGYDAARRDRLTGDWNPGNRGSNLLHQANASLIRERARDLVINNPMAQSGVDAWTANVVECGISPRPRLEDREQRLTWQQEYEAWCECGADLTCDQHLHELQALWLEEVIIGGGCLLHFVELSPQEARARGQAVPLAVELIPEERFCDDTDDWWTRGTRGQRALRKGQRENTAVVRGRELDLATGAAVAYWIKATHPNDVGAAAAGPGDGVRLPADQCVYGFFKRRTGQSRGFSLLAPAIMWLWKLGYYTDNELMASAIKSCFAAMIQTDLDADWADVLDTDDTSDTEDAFGNKLERLQPGLIWRGKPGDKISGVGPNTPPGDSAGWIELIQQSIAIGIGLSRSEMMRSTGKANFSAMRAERQMDQKRFRKSQKFTIHKFARPIWERFVRAAVLAGRPGFPSPAVFAADPHAFLRATWQTPGWPSVNPKDDAEANSIRLRDRTITRARIVGEEGGDWDDDVLPVLAREEDALREHDLAMADDSGGGGGGGDDEDDRLGLPPGSAPGDDDPIPTGDDDEGDEEGGGEE